MHEIDRFRITGSPAGQAADGLGCAPPGLRTITLAARAQGDGLFHGGPIDRARCAIGPNPLRILSDPRRGSLTARLPFPLHLPFFRPAAPVARSQ
jgi:hypothetical protein